MNPQDVGSDMDLDTLMDIGSARERKFRPHMSSQAINAKNLAKSMNMSKVPKHHAKIVRHLTLD